MTNETNTLLFAQWQGSGSPRARQLQSGAQRLAETLKADLKVDVERADLETQARIRGRAPLLQQLHAARALLIQARPTHLLTLGGDCGVDLVPASYLNARYGDLALVWLDAHADLNTPASSPSGAFHGMILRTLLGEGDAEFVDAAFKTFRPEQVFLAGARDFDPPERAYAERLEHLSIATLERQPERLLERIEARGFGTLHLHLDLDVLEPTEFAATGYPTPQGLSVAGLLKLLGLLAERFEVVGVTVTEFMPAREGDTEKVQEVMRAVGSSLP